MYSLCIIVQCDLFGNHYKPKKIELMNNNIITDWVIYEIKKYDIVSHCSWGNLSSLQLDKLVNEHPVMKLQTAFQV